MVQKLWMTLGKHELLVPSNHPARTAVGTNLQPLVQLRWPFGSKHSTTVLVKATPGLPAHGIRNCPDLAIRGSGRWILGCCIWAVTGCTRWMVWRLRSPLVRFIRGQMIDLLPIFSGQCLISGCLSYGGTLSCG